MKTDLFKEYDMCAVGKTPQGEILYAIPKELDNRIKEKLRLAKDAHRKALDEVITAGIYVLFGAQIDRPIENHRLKSLAQAIADAKEIIKKEKGE